MAHQNESTCCDTFKCTGVFYCCLLWFEIENPSTLDRKSTRLNSSHANISYAVFCLKKKRHCHEREALDVGAKCPFGAHVHLVLLPLLLVGRHFHASDQETQRGGDVGDAYAEAGGFFAVDSNRDLRFAGNERAVHVDRAGNLPKALLRFFGERRE